MTASVFETMVAAESAHEAAKAHHAALAADADRWIALCDDLPRELAVDLADAEVVLADAWTAFLVADDANWEAYQEYTTMKWLDRLDGAREYQEELAARC